MKKDSKHILCYLYVCFVVILLTWVGDLPVSRLYQGVELGGHEIFYMLYFMMFFTRVCLIMGNSEQYMQRYAIYTVVRSKSREMIWKNCIISAVKIVSLFYVWTLICSIVCTSIWSNGSIVWNPNVYREIVLFYSVDTLLMMIQLLLEVLINSRAAILLIGSFYMSSFFLADNYFQSEFFGKLCWFLFPNLGMVKRLPQNVFVYEVILITIVSNVILYLLGKNLINKKDIL